MSAAVLWFCAVLSAGSCFPGARILGGRECAPHSAPYQVLLRRHGGSWCGGSLISPDWVLTAAHCYVPRRQLVVWVGAHDLSANETWRRVHRVHRALRHPAYNIRTTDSDLMLLRVRPPVSLSPAVRPVGLPASCAPSGTECTVAGWGNTVMGGERFSERLRCLQVPVLPDTDCERSYAGHITSNMFCAGHLEGGKEACRVDSGGPLVCGEEQQGVVSWGYECGLPGYPSVYTRLCNYVDWINETITNI